MNNTVKAKKSNKKTITIDPKMCQELERLHYEYNSLVEVEKGYLDGHMMDETPDAIMSPIYEAYHKKTTEALKVYEEAKDALMTQYDLKNVSWNLDFKKCEVTID